MIRKIAKRAVRLFLRNCAEGLPVHDSKIKNDPAMLTCRIVSQLSDATAYIDRWDLLARHCQSGGPFQGPAWCLTWWKHLGKNAISCFLLICEQDTDLVAVAPLYLVKEHGLRFLQVMGDTEQADVSWMIGSNVDIESALDAMLARLCQSTYGWDGIKVYHIESAVMMESLRRVARKNGLRALIRKMGDSRYIDFRAGADAVLEGMSSKLRNTIKKGQRKAAQIGRLTFQVSNNMCSSDFADILYIEENSWKRQADFRLNRKREFYEEAFHALAQSGELRVSLLRIDTLPIAYLVSLKDSTGRVMAYETAFHREYGKISAGSLLHYEEIRSLAGETVHEFDFLGGSENYKSEWTNNQRPVYEIVLLRSRLYPFLYGIPYTKLKWFIKERMPIPSLWSKLTSRKTDKKDLQESKN